MPIYTTTGYEKRITAELEARGEHWSRSKIQRTALKLCKEQERMENLDWERIFTHSDPTPREAIRNIENESGRPVHSAATFPDHPDWPTYEAPARWYVQPGRLGVTA